MEYQPMTMTFYDDMAVQLAANAAGVGKLDGDLVSVLISTENPGEIQHKVWGNNQYWFDRFLARFEVWQFEKNYNPLEKTDD